MPASRSHKEEKKRDYSSQFLEHQGKHGGWHGPDVFKNKQCVVCNTEFKPKSGVSKFCSLSCKGKWQYISGRVSTESQYKTISGNWKRYFQRLCCRSNKRENLTWEDCIELLGKQDYKCALSGVLLTCQLEAGNICRTNASLDRIHPGGEYTKENVQLVCRALNSWRGDIPLEEFIDWCKKVADWQEEKENHSAF